jgi:ATP-dependent protease ClpP protease subunit
MVVGPADSMRDPARAGRNVSMVVQLPGAAPQAPPPTAFISFTGGINTVTAQHLINAMINCANQQIGEVHLLLSTPGGPIMDGINIYNVIQGLPFKLVTHNVGNVDSIGNAIFLAGEERYACPQATFMFHGVALHGLEGQKFEIRTTREVLASLRVDEARLIEIVTERTTLDKRQVRRLYQRASTKTAAEALSCGIVHDVRPVDIPSGVPGATFVFPG